MQKTILITGSTDGIGLETAKILVAQGHRVLIHGRNPKKLQAVENTLAGLQDNGSEIKTYAADLSRMVDVEALAKAVADNESKLDVLINNAGVLNASDAVTADGLDIRFVVNTFAPYLLAQRLLPLMPKDGRVVNLSSAAQAPINFDLLAGRKPAAKPMEAYAQSKLAITLWSRNLALKLKGGPVVVSVNPGSLLATKMVKEGFGVDGNDVGIGAGILVRAALSDEFATASGQYFDNDSGRFADPHPDALDPGKGEKLVEVMEAVLADIT